MEKLVSNFSVQVTSSADELNVLDGITTTLEAADLNLLDGAQPNTVVASKAIIYGSGGEITANTVALGSWTIQESGSDLKFFYSGSPRFKITSSGATVAINDVTAFGSV